MIKSKLVKLTLSGFMFMTSVGTTLQAEEKPAEDLVEEVDVESTEEAVEVLELETIDSEDVGEETVTVEKQSSQTRAIQTGMINDVTWTFDDVTGELSLSAGFLSRSVYNAPLASELGLDSASITKINLEPGIKFEADVDSLFSGLINLEEINGLADVDYSSTSRINYLFYNTPKLKEVDMTWPGFTPWSAKSAFEDSGVYYVHGTEVWSALQLRWADRMFGNTSNLEVLNLNWGTTPNLWYAHAMFVDSGVREINGFENFNFRDTTSITFMLSNTTRLEKINVGVVQGPQSTTELDAFFSGSGVKEIVGIEKLVTPNITSIMGMLEGTTNLKTIKLPFLEVPNNIKNLKFLFAESGIETVEGIENWDVTHVEELDGLFFETPDLKSVDLNWKATTSNVVSTYVMFSKSGVEEVKNLDSWDVSSLDFISFMFEKTTRLKEVNMNWNMPVYLDDMSGLFTESSVEKVDGLSNFVLNDDAYVASVFRDSAIKETDVPTQFLGTVNRLETVFEGANDLHVIHVKDTHPSLNFLRNSGLVHRDDLKFTGRWYSGHTTPLMYNSTNEMSADAFNQVGTYYREFHDYSVTYDSNGGDNNVPQTKVDWHMDDRVFVDFDTTPTKVGHKFMGWTDGVNHYTIDGESFMMPGADVTLQAIYQVAPYSLKVEIDGVLVDFGSVNFGDLVPNIPVPSKVGHKFVGWYTDATLSTEWDIYTDRVSDNLTLYPKFEKESYYVHYLVDGESVKVEAVLFEGILATYTPKREGYAFKGWYKDVALTQAWDYAVDTVQAETYLYSKWEKLDGPVVNPDDKKEDKKEDSKTPKTGVRQETVLYTSLFVVGLVALNVVLFKKKRTHN